jgi:hypothetical protein
MKPRIFIFLILANSLLAQPSLVNSDQLSLLQTKTITDTGSYFSTDTVEGALAQLGAAGGGGATNLTYTSSTRLLESSSGTDVTLPLVTSTTAGLAPLSGGGTSTFLRADGTWAVPPGGTGGIDLAGDFVWTGDHDYTGATVSLGSLTIGTLSATTATATTPAAADSDTSVATTAFVTEGKVQKIYTEKLAVSHTLTASECYGGVYYVTAASVVLTLPPVADGMSITVISTGINTVTVDPDAGDLIVRDGTAQADGIAITSTGEAGDIAVLTYYDSTGWYAATNSWTQQP